MSFDPEQIKSAFKDFESKIKNLKDLTKEEVNELLEKASHVKKTELKRVEKKVKSLKTHLEKDLTHKSTQLESKIKSIKKHLDKDWSEQSSKIVDEAKMARSKAQDLFKEYKLKVEKVIDSIK